MRSLIIVITDFTKGYWKDFINRLGKELPILRIDINGNAITEKAQNIKESHLALKLEISGTKKMVVLARQQNSDEQNKNIVSKIINEWLNDSDQIAICAHKSGGKLSTSHLPQVVFYETFHHSNTGDELWENIQNLFNNINDFSFDLFWKSIAPKPGDVTNLLRYEILSPLVALDLINQAEGNSSRDKSAGLNTLKNKIKEAIGNLDGPIKELCKAPIKCDDFKDQLEKLRQSRNFSCWHDYHKALEKVAEKMEEQIAKFPA